MVWVYQDKDEDQDGSFSFLDPKSHWSPTPNTYRQPTSWHPRPATPFRNPEPIEGGYGETTAVTCG